MAFQVTNDRVLFLYPYHSYSERGDKKSKEVYHVFKRGWGMDTYFPQICEDLFEAIDDYIKSCGISKPKVVVTIMPSHNKGKYGDSLIAIAKEVCREFDFSNACGLIQRTVDKTKSTDGGSRDVFSHMCTMGLNHSIDADTSADIYIVMDDITTTGSSLEAAKRVLINDGVDARKIVKIAIAKTMYDE